MASDQSNKNDKFVLNTILEAPPSPDLPAKEVAALINEDSIVTLTSKVMILESMFDLVTRNCNFNDFMREVLIATMKIVKSEAGSILEMDQDNKVLFFRSVVGCSSDRVTRFIVPLGSGLVGHVAESRQLMVLNSITDNDVYLKSIEKAVGFKARNAIAIPILVRGNVFGVLELLNRFGEDEYTQTDIEFLNYACSAASKAIEARLMLAWALQPQTQHPELKKAAA